MVSLYDNVSKHYFINCYFKILTYIVLKFGLPVLHYVIIFAAIFYKIIQLGCLWWITRALSSSGKRAGHWSNSNIWEFLHWWVVQWYSIICSFTFKLKQWIVTSWRTTMYQLSVSAKGNASNVGAGLIKICAMKIYCRNFVERSSWRKGLWNHHSSVLIVLTPKTITKALNGI